MRVILFRHATRSLQSVSDCSLNATGKSQAENLAENWVFPQGTLPKPTRLLASPKKRAQESFQPLAKALNLTVETDLDLDERHQSETAREFEARVKNVIAKFSHTDDEARENTIYLCSHLDWIEAFLQLVPTDLSEWEIQSGWSTLEFKVFMIKNGFWTHKQSGVIGST